jgi:hypothetical protein
VALTVDPARAGVDPSVADAVRAGTALERAGYAVEEVEPPEVEAAAQLWWRIVVTEIRQMTESTIRRFGDAGMKLARDVYLAAMPDVDLNGYIKDLAQRRKHLREWLQFLERYPLVVGQYRASRRCRSGSTPTPRRRGETAADPAFNDCSQLVGTASRRCTSRPRKRSSAGRSDNRLVLSRGSVSRRRRSNRGAMRP